MKDKNDAAAQARRQIIIDNLKADMEQACKIALFSTLKLKRRGAKPALFHRVTRGPGPWKGGC